MLGWHKPEISDGNWIRELVSASGNMGSDCTFANMYLLRDKYDIEICRYKDFLIRRYRGTGARLGYTFPIGRGDVFKALSKIVDDAVGREEKLSFAFVTEAQKHMLEGFMPGAWEYTWDAGDSDYVYLCRELATLSGRAFHKKKNHVSKFVRSYPDYEMAQLGPGNWEDAGRVADVWYDERRTAGSKESVEASLAQEYKAIWEAVSNFEELELTGGIIYVKGKPVAMTIASMTNETVCNIHFEKAVGEYAADGGYAAINQMFASQLKGVTYVNREEDVGIEGLRKAKMSYHPTMMIKKYGAVLR